MTCELSQTIKKKLAANCLKNNPPVKVESCGQPALESEWRNCGCFGYDW